MQKSIVPRARVPFDQRQEISLKISDIFCQASHKTDDFKDLKKLVKFLLNARECCTNAWDREKEPKCVCLTQNARDFEDLK